MSLYFQATGLPAVFALGSLTSDRGAITSASASPPMNQIEAVAVALNPGLTASPTLFAPLQADP